MSDVDVLSVLATLSDRPVTTGFLADQLRADPGAVYSRLIDLEDRDLVRSRLLEADTAWQLTPRGWRYLARELDAEAVDQFQGDGDRDDRDDDRVGDGAH